MIPGRPEGYGRRIYSAETVAVISSGAAVACGADIARAAIAIAGNGGRG